MSNPAFSQSVTESLVLCAIPPLFSPDGDGLTKADVRVLTYPFESYLQESSSVFEKMDRQLIRQLNIQAHIDEHPFSQ